MFTLNKSTVNPSDWKRFPLYEKVNIIINLDKNSSYKDNLCNALIQIYILFHFQTLNSISAEKNSTIIFPFPIDLVAHLLGPKDKDKDKNKELVNLSE